MHTVMSVVLCWYAPVHSKRPVGERLHSHRGIETCPANLSRIGSKLGWYGKVNQKSDRFANVPFHYRMNRKGRSYVGFQHLSVQEKSVFLLTVCFDFKDKSLILTP